MGDCVMPCQLLVVVGELNFEKKKVYSRGFDAFSSIENFEVDGRFACVVHLNLNIKVKKWFLILVLEMN